MKASDISDLLVCQAYEEASRSRRAPNRVFATDILARTTGAPEKVVLRAIERALDRHLIDYGVSLRSGWLTDKGEELLRENTDG